MEHIFGNLTQVQIEIASIIISVGFSVGIDEVISLDGRDILHIFWAAKEHISLKVVESPAFFVFLLIVFFGTIVAFILYLTGVNIIGPTKASIIACIEPVAATICAILFLGVSFGFLDLIGFICIISTIFIVAYFDKKTKK